MKNLKLLSFVIIFYLYGNIVHSQVTIGAITESDSRALLDLKNQTDNLSTKGILLPSVAIADTLTFGLTDDSKTAGMLVYNTASKNSPTKNKGKGIYYWNGFVWKWINNGISGANPNNWSLTENLGTIFGTNFLRTTDAKDLVIKTNSFDRMRILSTGNVSIGTVIPTQKLEVGGSGQINDVIYLKTTPAAPQDGTYPLVVDNLTGQLYAVKSPTNPDVVAFNYVKYVLN